MIISILLAYFLVSGKALAQAGVLDSTFGNGGEDTIIFNSEDNGYATGIAIQPDNKILVSGIGDEHDLLGRTVQTFISNKSQEAGKHLEELHFNKQLPAGEYIVSVGNGSNRQAIKITLMGTCH